MPPPQALVATHSGLILPPAIVALGEEGQRAFVDFFAAQIRNPKTRLAYARAVVRFLERADAVPLSLPQMQPAHVAAYIKTLSRTKPDDARYATATVKQHLSALKMLGDFLVIRQVLPAVVRPALQRYTYQPHSCGRPRARYST